MKTVFLIGIGGGIGSILRYGMSRFIGIFTDSTFPWHTLIVNLIGSLIIGLLSGYFYKKAHSNQAIVLFLTTGFCGGFTTFSAFTLENFQLFQTGNIGMMISNIMISVLLGIVAVGLGWWMVQ